MKEVHEFECMIAQYFGSKYAIATDSCTHAIELCLRYLKSTEATSPKHTYLSVPMTFNKLNIDWNFSDEKWVDYYYINNHVIDAAVYWKQNGYIAGTFMCLSFQYKKHLNVCRGGMILVDRDHPYVALKKMSYDGRIPDVAWAEQDISLMGYHYYMTPETATLGMKRFQEVKDIPPKKWSFLDYPDLSKLTVFKNAKVTQ